MATGNLPAADLARYRELISGSGLRDDEKDQMIHIVSNIMKAFVDHAFRQKPNIPDTIESKASPSQKDSSYGIVKYIQSMQPDFADASGYQADSVNAKDVRHDPASENEGRHLLPR